ncbi:MAG: 8-oxo-dGTP diphosphatase [Planctomycetota bacterium]|jgi:8-oxo-dGTP diphosphatase|nr:8-oxo-dGTP diphosphatase [Planctomycetota bacterium]
MPYTPILGTLGYILSPDRESVLMVQRIARQEDDHFGKYNGLGGKMLPEEDAATCMVREIREEAGIEVTEMSLRGTINWTNFGPKGENWLGFIFLIQRYQNEPWRENVEGPLSWVRLEDLPTLSLWEGDKRFLPLVFDNDPRPFHGVMPYANDRLLGWSYTRF